MTRQKWDLEGRRVSKEEVLKELGDPSTWEADAEALRKKQEEPYPPPTRPIDACVWCSGTGIVQPTGLVCRTCGGSGKKPPRP